MRYRDSDSESLDSSFETRNSRTNNGGAKGGRPSLSGLLPTDLGLGNKRAAARSNELGIAKSADSKSAASAPAASVPLTDPAVFLLIMRLREVGRRLALSDPTVGTAATLMHRALRVISTGVDAKPPSYGADGEDDDADDQEASGPAAKQPALKNGRPMEQDSDEDEEDSGMAARATKKKKVNGVAAPDAKKKQKGDTAGLATVVPGGASRADIEASIVNSLGNIDPHTIGMACVSLACKVQEEHRRLRDIILAYHRTLHKRRKQALEVGDEYDRLRESLVATELFVMRMLGFHVRRLRLPHSYLTHYLHALLHWVGKGIPGAGAVPGAAGGGAPSGGGGMGQAPVGSMALARLPGLAWSILADTYQLPMCLAFAPDHLAASVLHLALRIAGVEVPGNRHSEMAWWQAISDTLTREIVEQVQLRIMEVYETDDKILAPLSAGGYRSDADDPEDDF